MVDTMVERYGHRAFVIVASFLHPKWKHITREQIPGIVGVIVPATVVIGSAAGWYLRQETSPKPGVSDLTTTALGPICKIQRWDSSPSEREKQLTVNADCDDQSLVSESDSRNIVTYDRSEEPSVLSVFMYDAKQWNQDTFVLPYDTYPDGAIVRVFCSITYDYSANVRFYSLYFPDPSHVVDLLLDLSKEPQYPLKAFDSRLSLTSSVHGDTGGSAEPPPFSGTIYIYTEIPLPFSVMGDVDAAFRRNGTSLQFRSADRVAAIWNNIKLGVVAPMSKYELRGAPPEIQPVIDPIKRAE
jgi:hypothetical protein